jgi:hypothetical protein
MRPPCPLWLALVLGCNSSGTAAEIADSGPPDATLGDAATDAPPDATEESEGAPPCPPYGTGVLIPSTDCVFVGPCGFACSGGTASSFACNARSSTGLVDGSSLYPAVFTAPIGIVMAVGGSAEQYPWEAGAFLSCAPLSCVRWSTADHVDGGSAWPGDPCNTEAGLAEQAWACPTSPGIVPGAPDCFNSGAFNAVGGAGTGIAINNVWCCPADLDAAVPLDAMTESGLTGDASSDAPMDAPSDAPVDALSEGGVGAPDAGLDAPGE